MYRKELDKQLEDLNTSLDGLSAQEANARLQEQGRNELQMEAGESAFSMFFANFKDVMILVLLCAGILSAVLGEYVDAILIGIIVVLNAIIGTVQQVNAQKAVDSLKDLSASKCLVRRDGHVIEIDAKDLVNGDIVIVETGSIIPADGRLVRSVNLKINESNLTGENLPVEKDENFQAEENLPIGDRKNMVFSSTVVSYGRGEFVVTAIGMQTEIGKIAFMVIGGEEERTPLQVKIDKVGKLLASLVVLVAIGVFALGKFQGRETTELFFTAIAIAVAAIPEGLPTVISVVLSLGAKRLANRKAIVKGLTSVETLGSAGVICTDKTGTLTQNNMSVQEVSSGANMNQMILGMSLCNDAKIGDDDTFIGDPTETALLAYAIKQEKDLEEIYKKYPRVQEIPFDSTRKRMSTLHEDGLKFVQYTKGAIDGILELCDSILVGDQVQELTSERKKEILEENNKFSMEAMRVLSLAKKEYSDLPEKMSEQNMIFVGSYAMIDPPRESTRTSILECLDAGIIPVMVTGDHLITAKAIGKKIGLYDEEEHLAMTGSELAEMDDESLFDQIESIRIFARVAPEQKVRIVDAWQRKEMIVAMTGDGVNDAPAIKKAEIGIAMGNNGTDVSRDAADVILMDDNFATIVSAVEEGRTIFDNIKRTIRYLLSCNLGEIMLIVAAMIFAMPIPLRPIHILWINLVSDGMPAIALGFEPQDEDVMKRKPRGSNEGILGSSTILMMIFEAIIIAGVSFVAFIYVLDYDLVVAQTMTFMTLAFSQLIHGANVRSDGSLFKKGIFGNKYYLLTFVISIVLQVALVSIPVLANAFHITALSLNQWLIVAGLSIVPLIATEIRKLIIKG